MSTEPPHKPLKLTKRVVDELTYQGTNNGACYVWDAEIKGFGVRVFPSGRKAFLVAYRTGRRKRFHTIGTFGKDLTVDEARKEARAKLGDVARGIDPAEARERERRGEKMRDLCIAYMDRHGNNKKSGREDQRRIDRHILPEWADLKVCDIKRADISGLHSKIGKKNPIEANRILALLSTMFNLATIWGFAPEDHPNPARKIPRFKETKRDRWVTPEELPQLAQAINEESNRSARFGLWLYLLTGARKNEILKAQWSHIDWNRQEMKIEDPKTGGVHYIPLSSAALELLQLVPREEGNPYILPGKKPGSHLVNIDKAWNRVREAAGIEDVHIHDLRRTVGSWLAQAGNSLHLIGRVLNHSNQSTTAIYARFGEDSIRSALEEHGARILGVAGVLPATDELETSARNEHVSPPSDTSAGSNEQGEQTYARRSS